MKNKFIVFYTILISLIYAFAITFFGYNLLTEISTAKQYPSYTPNYSLINNTFKVAFLIILAATILTFIIIFLSKDENNSAITTNTSVDYKTTGINTDILSAPVTTEETINKEEPVVSSNTQPVIQQIVSPIPQMPVQTVTPSAPKEPVKTPSELPSNEYKPMNMTPEGLFSPVTGFGWESYLLTRLDGELKRAISSEFDLALFIIRLPELDRNSEVIQEICNYLTVQFQFKDLVFEYNKDCFVAIKTNMNLDDALNLADKLHFEINYMLEKVEKKCFIGISTRTIRIISGERLLNEAYEALKHAQEDEENPIIAFRANAEKYMKLIQKQNEM